jgi:hypothetical protein
MKAHAQSQMFAQGEDLPLMSGTPIAAKEVDSQPHTSKAQMVMPLETACPFLGLNSHSILARRPLYSKHD